jgi:hypothetical protein
MQPDAAFGHCTSDSDCNDNATCTIDQCDVNMMCQHTAIDAMCAAGETCQPFVGCTTMQTCSSNAQCDDSIACTVDGCSSAHVCTHMAVDALCASTPATPVCNTAMGCVAGSSSTCRSMADCDDMVACTVDSCGVDMMCHHTTVDASCPMGQRCTTTGCVMMHACTTAANCMDPSFWNFCDGDPVCSTEFGCMNPSPRMCDDGNPCTLDSCDPAAGTNGQCVTACDTSMGAACATDPACAAPGPTCAGRFMLSPAPVGNCGAPPFGVTWNLAQITMMNAGGSLTILPNHLSTSSGLTSPPGSCPSFTATSRISGGCVEDYTITGTFTDDNTFTGMFTATFTDTDGSCALAGCGGTFNYSFTGTRI